MGDGRIFLKTRCDVSFNKVLSNEPTFGQGQEKCTEGNNDFDLFLETQTCDGCKS